MFGHPVTLEATYHCIVMVKFAHVIYIMFMILSNMFNYVHLVDVDLDFVRFGSVRLDSVCVVSRCTLINRRNGRLGLVY